MSKSIPDHSLFSHPAWAGQAGIQGRVVQIWNLDLGLRITERGYPESSSEVSTPATGHRTADRPKLAAKAA